MTDAAEIKVKFEMRDGFAEVTTISDLGEELAERQGPYLLTEMSDVRALTKFVNEVVTTTALSFLAKTGEEICEERIT